MLVNYHQIYDIYTQITRRKTRYAQIEMCYPRAGRSQNEG